MAKGIDLESDAQRRLLEAMAQSPEAMGQQDQVFAPGGMPAGMPMRDFRAQQKPVKPAPLADFIKKTQERKNQFDAEAYNVLDQLKAFSPTPNWTGDPGAIMPIGRLSPEARKAGGGYTQDRGWHVGWKHATPEQMKILQDAAARHGITVEALLGMAVGVK